MWCTAGSGRPPSCADGLALRTVRPAGSCTTTHARWVACRPNIQLHMGQPLSRVSMVSDLPERWSRATIFPDMWVDPEEDLATVTE
jgi:hypothetical protein